jgi:uncharacterized membrane protein YgdD (TMEM256/DUF423 family)
MSCNLVVFSVVRNVVNFLKFHELAKIKTFCMMNKRKILKSAGCVLFVPYVFFFGSSIFMRHVGLFSGFILLLLGLFHVSVCLGQNYTIHADARRGA